MLCVIALSSRDRGSVIGMTGDWHPHDSMNEGIWEGQEINQGRAKMKGYEGL